jgi:RHS repeat-associated protein
MQCIASRETCLNGNQIACLDTSAQGNSGTTLFSLSYAYGSSGSNNGQIMGITDNVDNGRSASYGYDALGRLSAATTSGSTAYPAWGLSFTYDRYGNRTAQSIASGCTGITCPTNSLTASTSTNRATDTGFGYDASGNMINDGLNTLTYDAASRQISASNGSSSGSYVYDGNGLRAKKCVPNCTSPTTTTIYISSGGKVLAEYDNGASVTSPSREYIYSGGTMIAKIAGSTTTYYHNDHLSNRVVTNSSGTVVEQLGHMPYGESWYDTGSEKHKFTTYERDAESGNDFAMARYDVSRLGRFASPDPLSGSISNPQSLNHYTYAGNDPINAADPTGMDLVVFKDECTDTHIINDPWCTEGGDGGAGWWSSFGKGGAGGDTGFWADPETTCGDWFATNACDGSDAAFQASIANCVRDLYGVTETLFEPATADHPGVFVGQGKIVGTDVNTPVSPAINGTIVVNAISMPVWQTPRACGSPEASGCTLPGDWSQTIVPTFAGGSDQQLTTWVQLVELGNALTAITGKMTWDQIIVQDQNSNYQNPPGTALTKCMGFNM